MEAAQEPQPSALAASEREVKKKKIMKTFHFLDLRLLHQLRPKQVSPQRWGSFFILFWNLLPNPAERWIYHLRSIPVALTRQERTRFRGGQRRRDGLNFGVDVLAPSHRVTSADTLVRAVQIARTSFGLVNLRTLVCLITGDKRWPASTSPLYFTVSICVDF